MLLQLLQRVLNASTLIYGVIVLALSLCGASVIIIRTGNVFATRRKLRNLRKLGLSTSNMTDQYDLQFNIPEGTVANASIRIKAIYIHPVKSCAPIELDRALLTKTGFLYDRCCAIAAEEKTRAEEKESEWRLVTQRTKPNMALIKTEIWTPHTKSDAQDPLVQAGGSVVLSFPDPDAPSCITRLEAFLYTWSICAIPMVSIIVPLQPTPAQIAQYKIGLKSFGIHARDAKGLDLGLIPSVAEMLPKLKRFLRISEHQGLSLLTCTQDTLTRTDRNLAPLSYIGTPAVHGYTDQQPIHINSLSSVHAVSALLPSENQPLNALRFRANIWFTGATAYDEESWKRFRIVPKRVGLAPRARVAPTVSVVCRTARCTMPNIDPAKGTFDTETSPPGKKKGKPQPSTALVAHRTVEDGNGAALGYLGMHCVPEDPSLKEAEKQGKGLYVEVGDEIEVLERGTHLFGSTGNDY